MAEEEDREEKDVPGIVLSSCIVLYYKLVVNGQVDRVCLRWNGERKTRGHVLVSSSWSYSEVHESKTADVQLKDGVWKKSIGVVNVDEGCPR